jgi:hypothetical protein
MSSTSTLPARPEAPVFHLGRETLPARWDAELVGRRLVQAFVTLGRLPQVRGPRALGGHWPTTIPEWADQLGIDPIERKMREEAANRTVIHASGADITHMEAAFEWLRPAWRS